MKNQFLIPANTKKSLLYFGVFNKFDAILFGTGITVSLLAVSFLQTASTVILILAIMPALVTGFLVLPVPNYYNMRTIIKSIFNFYTTRQRFIWKGWCFQDEESRKK